MAIIKDTEAFTICLIVKFLRYKYSQAAKQKQIYKKIIIYRILPKQEILYIAFLAIFLPPAPQNVANVLEDDLLIQLFSRILHFASDQSKKIRSENYFVSICIWSCSQRKFQRK